MTPTGEYVEPAITYLWRVGRKLGRTIYVQVGPEPSDADVLIGVMDVPSIAYEAVEAHNLRLQVASWHDDPGAYTSSFQKMLDPYKVKNNDGDR